MANPKNNMRPWKEGDDPSAKHWNEVIESVNDIVGGVSPPYQSITGDKIPPIMRQFKIKEIDDDFLKCVTWDGVAEGTALLEIGKPYLLRKTPFDFDVSEGYTRTLPNGRTNKYTYLNYQKRKVINTEDEDDTEIQVIVPAYVVGDVIYAYKGMRGGIDTKNGVSQENTGGGINPYAPASESEAPLPRVNLFWLDTNNDGRAWAKASDQDDET